MRNDQARLAGGILVYHSFSSRGPPVEVRKQPKSEARDGHRPLPLAARAPGSDRDLRKGGYLPKPCLQTLLTL
jgi:hypothetical protein